MSSALNRTKQNKNFRGTGPTGILILLFALITIQHDHYINEFNQRLDIQIATAKPMSQMGLIYFLLQASRYSISHLKSLCYTINYKAGIRN
jgi:hypothetical protein